MKSVETVGRGAAEHAIEVERGERFAFGRNWTLFLSGLTEQKIADAGRSLQRMLGVQSLHGQSFLDVGSGSGLFSLAARQLGASVHSFDFDPQSVACTAELRRRYFPDDKAWTVEEGSILDREYLSALGQFDLVYSWGVLHHTGQMAKAFENVASLVSPGGALFIAIYNDQGWPSRYWSRVKRAYNRGGLARLMVSVVHLPYLFGLRYVVRTVTGKGALDRGMSMWRDAVDWLGGYPFEVAKPETVFQFFRDRGFRLDEMRTCGGRMGCNEFVFRREPGQR